MTSPQPEAPESTWQAFLTRQCARTAIDGTVTTIMPFGAFIKLDEGVEGLLHRSERSAPPNLRPACAGRRPHRQGPSARTAQLDSLRRPGLPCSG